MLKDDYPGQSCSIARTLEIVGERWTLLIVRELIRKPRRFLELEHALGMAKNVLTSRLAKLQATGIVEKEAVVENRDWGTYVLTRKGRDLFPVINAMMSWGDRHAAPDGPPITLLHSCGGKVGHKLVCECCGGDVHLRDLAAADG